MKVMLIVTCLAVLGGTAARKTGDKFMKYAAGRINGSDASYFAGHMSAGTAIREPGPDPAGKGSPSVYYVYPVSQQDVVEFLASAPPVSLPDLPQPVMAQVNRAVLTPQILNQLKR